MRVMVTGDTGFIGRHLCRRLRERGDQVLPAGDVINRSFPYSADLIYNLASPTAPTEYRKNPVKTLLTNTVGLRNVMEFSQWCKAPVVHISTIRVLDDVDHRGPHAPYVEGKRIAELFAWEYAKAHQLKTTVVRLPSVYGPGMLIDDTRVIPSFIRSALRHEPIELWGGGSQVDWFTYIDDAVDDILSVSHCKADLFTVPTTSSVSIREIAEKVALLSSSVSKIVSVGEFNGKSRAMLVDKSPKCYPVGIEEGLRRTINDFRKRMSEE